MPGDPLRAKWIAENFLDDAECYTQVRGMLGFTGTYRDNESRFKGPAWASRRWRSSPPSCCGSTTYARSTSGGMVAP